MLNIMLSSWTVLWIIGASLSEPHTNGTALQDACVCLRVAIYRKFQLSERITKDRYISNLHTCSIDRVERRLPGVEKTEVQAHMATYSLFYSTAGCRQAVQSSITTVVEIVSGKGHA